MKNKLMDVYVETANGWYLLYKDIPEDIALEFWRAGFKTGENKISYLTKAYRESLERQTEKLHNR